MYETLVAVHRQDFRGRPEQLRTEADVEAARTVADRERNQKVPKLVEED